MCGQLLVRMDCSVKRFQSQKLTFKMVLLLFVTLQYVWNFHEALCHYQLYIHTQLTMILADYHAKQTIYNRIRIYFGVFKYLPQNTFNTVTDLITKVFNL